MRTARTLIAAALLFAAPAAAQPRPAAPFQQLPTPLDWLAGSWRGAGTMMGRASQASLTVRPALAGRWLELSYRAGPFEGRAFYRARDDVRYRATWFDNRGISFDIEGMVEGQTLTSNWGNADTEQGRTVYRLAADGRLHITDSVRRDGGYREFASHVLTRAN